VIHLHNVKQGGDTLTSC